LYVKIKNDRFKGMGIFMDEWDSGILRRRMEDEKFNNSVSDWSVEGALSEIQR
jgi:hypothetical protein